MTMKIVKVLSIALLAVAVSAGLTACMNDGGTTAPQQTTGFMPETTAAPNADMTATQPPVAFDWVTGSAEFEELRAADAERIRQMVAAEVVKADPSIQTVAVTAEPEDVNRVYEISEALRAGSPADSQTDAINEIVRNATTLR